MALKAGRQLSFRSSFVDQFHQLVAGDLPSKIPIRFEYIVPSRGKFFGYRYALINPNLNPKPPCLLLLQELLGKLIKEIPSQKGSYIQPLWFRYQRSKFRLEPFLGLKIQNVSIYIYMDRLGSCNFSD